MSIQESIRYGAAELKRFYNRNLGLALAISVGFHLLLIFLYIFGTNLGKARTTGGPPVVAKMKLENIAPPPEDKNVPPPPPPMIPPQLQTSGSGTGGVAARAGNPVAVPDALITPEMKDFATTTDISVATPQGGDGTGFGGTEGDGLGAPIDIQQPVEIKEKEKIPEPDEFLPDVTEPGFDYDALKKRVIYPEMAKKNNIEGKVVVRVLVDPKGHPKKYVIDASDNKILEKAAVDAVMSTNFSPGVQNGNPVYVWVSIPIDFQLH
jgi:protein TonB